MKKTLLTLFMLVAAMCTASAQTNLIENGDFEAWAEGAPVNWNSKPASTASSATLVQSTVAHGGTYAVLIKGDVKSNKRLAYKDITLKAGTYTVKAFAKSVTADTAGIKLGYVPFKADGTLDTGRYTYQDVATDLVDSWAELTFQFELKEATRLNLVAMNSKTPKGGAKYGKDLILDDYTITTTNGGIAEGGEVKPEPQPEPQPEGDAIFAETFAEGVGAFTVDNKVLPEGATNIWQFASNYKCMKASAFIGGATHASESWLVSPVIDLTKTTDAVLSFENAANKFNGAPVAEACLVKVKAEGADWANATIENLPAGTNWNFQPSTVDLKAYNGKKIQIAFVYMSTDKSAGTWEVKNVKVAGKGGEVKPDPQPQPGETVYTTIADLKKNAVRDETPMTFEFKELTVIAKAGNDIYVSDGKEATLFYASENTLNVGDKISGKIKGNLTSFFGLTEVKSVDYTGVTVVSKGNAVAPIVVTLEELAAEGAFAKLESQLVVVKGIKVGAKTFENLNIDMIDGATKVTLRDNYKSAIDFKFDTTASYDITGVIGQFKNKVQINLLSTEGIKVSTGIEGVEAENGEQVIYDLSGRRVAKAVKGLYIINGKKVFVK